MRGLYREMFPAMKTSSQTITPYWGTFDEDETRRQLAEADVVVSQAVANDTTTFNANDVRASATGDVIFVHMFILTGSRRLRLLRPRARQSFAAQTCCLRGKRAANRSIFSMTTAMGRLICNASSG